MENLIPSDLLKITKEFKEYLIELQKKFDDFDKICSAELQQSNFINKQKTTVFSKLDFYFKQFDKLIITLTPDSEASSKDFFRAELIPIIGKPEINNYIFTKPLGYSGDFVMMNLIYDYYDKFYGKSSFYKLINYYTCNIPVSKANIKRKEYIKKTLQKEVESKKNIISSIGCGPAREVIELIEDGVNFQNTIINLFDFEKKALDFIKFNLGGLKGKIPVSLKINFIEDHIVSILLKKDVREILGGQNIIYCMGVFDYLKTPIARRLLKTLFSLLANSGILIICNISSERSSHRSYYEFLGGWVMFHRPKEELLSWAEGAKIPLDFCEIRNLPEDCYNYLIIKNS